MQSNEEEKKTTVVNKDGATGQVQHIPIKVQKRKKLFLARGHTEIDHTVMLAEVNVI